jgi:16S rRNA (cytidine1402-2'-O)-methyltransferase
MNSSADNYGLLYIVATPIGNLEDITLRALRILKTVDLIAAEDTRHTRKLLNAYEITTSLISLHEHNEKEKSSLIISKIKSGMTIAYVSDAGTPCISDPGFYLINLAHQEKLRVVPIPGPSAVVTALSASGFPADNFLFCGFMPEKKSKRRQFLETIKEEERTIVFYESPMRIKATLQDMYDVIGDREIVIARELTKLFEEIRQGRISEFLNINLAFTAKGEFTVILKEKKKELSAFSDREIADMLAEIWKNNKVSLHDAVVAVAARTGLSRKRIYSIAVGLRSEK